MISIEIYRIFAQSRIYVRRDSWIEIANDSVVWHIDNKNKNAPVTVDVWCRTKGFRRHFVYAARRISRRGPIKHLS